jgi:hypothetical protein
MVNHPYVLFALHELINPCNGAARLRYGVLFSNLPLFFVFNACDLFGKLFFMIQVCQPSKHDPLGLGGTSSVHRFGEVGNRAGPHGQVLDQTKHPLSAIRTVGIHTF